MSREVITETVRGATHVATRWHLASRHRAPWKWISPQGLAGARGTAVRLVLTNQLSPLTDAGYVEEVIRRHFEPLFDPDFDEFVRRKYRAGVGFEVDGRHLPWTQGFERAPVSLRMGRRRTPSAIGFLERHAFLPVDRQGIAISTFGKVIKRGWDWLGITPANPRIGGLIEVPDLAACLTLSKNDFIRTGTRGATYLAYRKAVQEVVSRQLTAWGTAPAQRHDRGSPGSNGTSSACSRIWPTRFPCCNRWSIDAPEGRSAFRCPGADTSRCPRRSSRTSRQATKAQSSNRSIRNVPSRRDSRRSRDRSMEPGQPPNTDPGRDAEPPPARSDSH